MLALVTACLSVDSFERTREASTSTGGSEIGPLGRPTGREDTYWTVTNRAGSLFVERRIHFSAYRPGSRLPGTTPAYSPHGAGA